MFVCTVGGKKEAHSEIIRSFEFIVYINLQTRKIPVILETVIRTSSFLPRFTAIYLKLRHIWLPSTCTASRCVAFLFPPLPSWYLKTLKQQLFQLMIGHCRGKCALTLLTLIAADHKASRAVSSEADINGEDIIPFKETSQQFLFCRGRDSRQAEALFIHVVL